MDEKKLSNYLPNYLKDPRILIPCLGVSSLFIIGMIVSNKSKNIEKAKICVGIELGGTNYHIAIGKPQFDKNNKLADFRLLKQQSGRVTNKPQQTLKEIQEKIVNHVGKENKIDFIGISTFGPLQLHKDNQHYGTITSTPKQGWKNTPILANLKKKFNCSKFSIQTDVNSAALAQFQLGKHRVKQSLVYITVGTGVGVGVICHKTTVHGLTHPEGGHIIVSRHPKQYQNFHGVCPFHKNCLEGMIANHSISERTAVEFTRLHEIEDNAKIWQIVGYYLAQLCLNLTLIVSPQKIVIGGGILNRKIIYKYIHQYFIQMLANYVQHPLLKQENIKQYIVQPALGSEVGVKGALLLKYV